MRAPVDVMRPPARPHGPEWDRWCAEMRRRGYSAWWCAQRAGVSETAVTMSWHRTEAKVAGGGGRR